MYNVAVRRRGYDAAGSEMANRGVPIVDLEPFFRGPEPVRLEVARRIDAVYRTSGFVIVRGHRVPPDFITQGFDVARAFFAQPLDAKMRWEAPTPDVFRGYNPPRSQGSAYERSGPSDIRENFMIGPLETADPYYRRPEFGRTYAANMWPAHPPAYRPVFERLYRAWESLARDLMRLFALGLGLPEDFFANKIDRHSSTCVANHYPEQPDEPRPGEVRAAEHTDVGSVTILSQDRARGGLEILDRVASGWIDVVTEPDELVINLGDLMARWTNDRWVSTRHRVVNPPRSEAATNRRMSLTFFQHPNWDAVVECVPTCVSPDRPCAYPAVLAGEHMHRRMLAARIPPERRAAVSAS
jgi:isopenicillin N synthase-like dioxygenase